MIRVINEDCRKFLIHIDSKVDLVITSPPYGKLRHYGHTYNKETGESLWKDALLLIYNVLKKGGVCVWIVADSVVKGSETLDSFKQALFAKQIGFKVYDTMIWKKPSPQAPTTGRYYDVFEYMFIFSKGKPKTLNLLKDRKNKSAGTKSKRETRSCKEQRKYTDKIRIVPEYSRRFNVWECGRGQSKFHPAVFPQKLIEDHIKTWSNAGDLVVDPFMGSGTTALACIKTNRNFIGIEINSEYASKAKASIKRLLKI